MGEDGESDLEEDGAPPREGASRPFKKRERVTLRLSAPPLLLPGETDGEPSPEAGELRFPPATSELAEPTVSDDVQDGWSRERPSRSRPPSQPAFPIEGEEEAGALGLVARRSRPSSPTIDLSSEMHDRFALGDYTTALRVAELILGRHERHEEAARISRTCREKLASLYGSRLGPLDRRPALAVEDEEVRWLGLDHRAGFLLSRVDGAHTLEELIDISSMQRLDALRTLVELLEMGAICFRD